ncbi:VIR protein [Plasmodium vivax]|uniref:VIR protein n=1 Tax=Plasmodium vivax TaxID=5855 RepID=A0A1G4ECV8_PLAVI|nr:VIR protein [Plasmodium vivax]
MSKPGAAPAVSAADLEKAASALNLHRMHEDYLVKKTNIANSDEYCKIFDKKHTNIKDAKNLCNNMVHFIKDIAEKKTVDENTKLCSYFPYWLYDEIGKIHNDHNNKISNIPFIKDLIDAGNNAIKAIKTKRCKELPYDGAVSLDEWKKRKISYIYLKKYNDNLKNIKAKPNDKCKLFTTYLNNMTPLYSTYKKECKPSFLWVVTGPDYADCNSTNNPNNLLALLKDCKESTGSGSTGWGSLFSWSSSSNRASSTGRDNTAAVVSRAGGSTTDKGRQEVSKSLVTTRDSQVLTSSQSGRGSAGPVAAATVGNRALPREASSGPSVTLQPKGAISPQSQGTPVKGVLAGPSYSADIRTDSLPAPIIESPSTLGTVNEKLDSSFYRNIIMAAAILGTIFFLFYYNMTSGLKSRFPKRKRKKKIFEHNYYEEYEKELAKYDSENESIDSQSDRYYLNYQPEGDTYY